MTHDATRPPFDRPAALRRQGRSGIAGVAALAAAAALAATALAQKPPAAPPAKTAQAQAQAPRPPAVMVIPGARVLDAASGRYLPPATIVIENGRIKSVSPGEPAGIPDTATILKTDGGVVVPGLIDAHAWAAPTADLDADYSYLMGLAHGVTTYRVLNARTSWAVGQRSRARSGVILAPRLVTSGRGIQQGATPGRWLFDAPDAQAAAAEVRQQVAAGVDWIAADDGVGPDVIKGMQAAVKDSPVRISAWPGASSMADLAALGVASIESLGYPLKPRAGSVEDAWLAASAAELTALRAALVRSGVVLVPMLAAARMRAYPDEVIGSPALALLPAARREALKGELKKLSKADVAKAKRVWALQAAFVVRFVRAGGRTAAGSGFERRGYPPPGVGVHLELEALVSAGIGAEDALRAATTTPAELMNLGTEVGLVAPGAEANLLIVQGDPLKRVQDLRTIASIVRGGEVLDARRLLARAQEALAVGPR